MFRSEQHLRLLKDKRDRLAERLGSGSWSGDKSKGLLEYDALEWACGVLEQLLSGTEEQVEGALNGRLPS